MKRYDVCVVGGGPAGIMAALTAKSKHPEYSVIIADRTFELGRKFLTSGAGRGNLTNVNLSHGPGDHYHGDQQFIASVFSRFGYAEIMAFFDRLGVLTYEERKTGRGKIFPRIDHARTVRNMFVDTLVEAGIEIVVNATVTGVVPAGDDWDVRAGDSTISSRRVILSTGGKTYPALGSDGTGYEIAASFGHRIVDPVVSAVPIVSKNALSHFLQGEKTVMEVTAVIGAHDIARATGDVMFTQYGFSGPAIFDVSREFSISINRQHRDDCAIRLSFFPGQPPDAVKTLLTRRWRSHPSYPVANSLWGILTEKAAAGICAASKLPKDKIVRDLEADDIQSLIRTLTAFEAPVTGTRGWNEAEFTAGGVVTDEIDHDSMESRKARGIHIVGEILDVDGDVGGFNLSWAWATGWIAGDSV